MKNICWLILFSSFAGSVNAQSFFTSVKVYKYSNDTVYAEVVGSIRSFSDVCHQIEVLGTKMTGSGTSKLLQLYYHSPNATGNGIPMDCVVTDTIKITPITGNVKSISLHLFTVVPITPNTGDTTDENSSVIIFLPLDVNNLQYHENDIVVYPNPANDVIFIRGVKRDTRIEIFDIAGKRIYPIAEKSTGGIDINSLAPGVYFVKLVEASGGYQATKFIKAGI